MPWAATRQRIWIAGHSAPRIKARSTTRAERCWCVMAPFYVQNVTRCCFGIGPRLKDGLAELEHYLVGGIKRVRHTLSLEHRSCSGKAALSRATHASRSDNERIW